MQNLTDSATSSVEDVLITSALSTRPARTPNFEAESRALGELATVMAESPGIVLQKLADTALELCHAGSAGVSIWEPGSENVFRWRATAGEYARYLGGTLPRDFSPCGTVLDLNKPLLMADPVRVFPYIDKLHVPAREVLLVPFYRGSKAIGTVWVVAHSTDRAFDAEDARFLTSLTRFAGAAAQTLERIDDAEKAESLRQTVQTRLEATLSAAEIGTWTWDIESDTVVADANLARMFEMTPSEAAGGALEIYTKAIHADDRERVGSDIQRAIEDGESLRTDYRIVHSDGGILWVVARGQVVRDNNGRAVRLPGVAIDVTGQRQAETDLRSSEDRRRLALDSAGLGSWQVVPDTMELKTDARFRSIFGISENSVDYTAAVACIHPEDQSRVQAAVQASIRPLDPAPYEVEYRVIRPDGSVRWVFAKGRANFDATGHTVLSFDGTVADVTEHKRLNDALRQLAADLSEAGNRKDEFLATLAHELRNPLAPIRNGLSVIRAGATEAMRERAVGMMERQLGQLVHLVNDLLDVSRVSTGKVTLRRELVALRTVTDGAVETSRPLIEADGHTLSIDLPAKPMFVDADPTRLTQVLTNLLNNAAKYTPRGGQISLSAAREGNEAVIRVTDNGVGIPPALLPKVFDMFMQVGTALERSQGGLGLGLTLVRKLVEMHGGTVSVESGGDGMGSTFTVRLPLAEKPAEAPLSTATRPTHHVSRRVLVVDDNKDGADSLSQLLELEGNEVRTAYTGPDAITAALSFKPDLALLDIGLPGLNGYEVAMRLRNEPELNNCFLVALTGWGTEEDRARATGAGFNAHLTKPAEVEKVTALIAKLG